MAVIERIGAPPPVVPPPEPGPPVGAPPGGCEKTDTFPATTKGAAPTTVTYTFTNTLLSDITISSVTIQPGATGNWKVDDSQLRGMLKRGATRSFTVTFTPPAK